MFKSAAKYAAILIFAVVSCEMENYTYSVNSINGGPTYSCNCSCPPAVCQCPTTIETKLEYFLELCIFFAVAMFAFRLVNVGTEFLKLRLARRQLNNEDSNRESKEMTGGGGGCLFVFLKPDTSNPILNMIREELRKEGYEMWQPPALGSPDVLQHQQKPEIFTHDRGLAISSASSTGGHGSGSMTVPMGGGGTD